MSDVVLSRIVMIVLSLESGLFSEYSNYINITKNIFTNNTKAISLDAVNDFFVNENYFENNTEDSLLIQDCGDIIVYNNSFMRNWDNPRILSGVQIHFNFTNIGNFWYDYNGKDSDDDGIGDTTYNIYPGYVDQFPIWWDAPNFTIINPTNYTLTNKTTPIIDLNIFDGIVDSYYYTINESENVFFNGPDDIFDSINWAEAGNGTLKIVFYVNDSRNYISTKEITIFRDSLGPNITIFEPDTTKIFNITAPNSGNFTITFEDGNGISDRWYMLYNLSTQSQNYTWNGEIDQSIWNIFGNGTIILRIYANDSLGNVNFVEVNFQKDILGDESEHKADEETKDGDSDKEDPKSEPNIIDFLASPIGIGIISVSILVAVAIVYTKSKGSSRDKEIKRIEEITS